MVRGTLNQEEAATGLGQIFSAVSGTQIDSYNFETLLLAGAEVDDLAARLEKARCEIAKTIDGYEPAATPATQISRPDSFALG